RVELRRAGVLELAPLGHGALLGSGAGRAQGEHPACCDLLPTRSAGPVPALTRRRTVAFLFAGRRSTARRRGSANPRVGARRSRPTPWDAFRIPRVRRALTDQKIRSPAHAPVARAASWFAIRDA